MKESGCIHEGCLNRHWARGRCNKHYLTWKKSQDIGPCAVSGCTSRALYKTPHLICAAHYAARRRSSGIGNCSIDGCAKGATVRTPGLLCDGHYHRIRHGKSVDVPLRRRGKPGDGHINKLGYKEVRAGGLKTFEHRLVMEESLGRKLLPGENVHHKNGDRLDNRLVKGHEFSCPSGCCNLELWVKNQPSGQRVVDVIAWAKELLGRYGSAA